MFVIKKSLLISMFVAAILFCCGFFLYLRLDLSDVQSMSELGLISFDSLNYLRTANSVEFSGLSLKMIVFGGLNWLTLPFMAHVFGEIGLGNFGFLILNSFAFFYMLNATFSMFPGFKANFKVAMLVVISWPYLLSWSLAPNKEMLMAAFAILILKSLYFGNVRMALFFAFLGGLFKIQILAAFLMFLAVYRLRCRKTALILALCCLVPFAIHLHPGLTIHNFVENQVNEIRTAAFFETLDRILAFPFGYLVVAPIRLFANLLAGGYPNRIISSTEIGGALAPVTSFVLAIVSLAFFLKTFINGDLKRYFASQSDWSLYLLCLLSVQLMVPYLQPRYFWWGMPLMIVYLFARKKIPPKHVQIGKIHKRPIHTLNLAPNSVCKYQ